MQLNTSILLYPNPFYSHSIKIRVLKHSIHKTNASSKSNRLVRFYTSRMSMCNTDERKNIRLFLEKMTNCDHYFRLIDCATSGRCTVKELNRDFRRLIEEWECLSHKNMMRIFNVLWSFGWL